MSFRPTTIPFANLRVLGVLCVKALLPAAALLLITGCDRNQHPEQLGTPAPTFTLNDGQHSVDLARLRGRVVILNFWASWCAPCLQELPSMEALHAQMPEVEIVGVSIDLDKDAYEQFLQLHHVDFLTVLDSAQTSNALYNTYRPPETYIIDKQGNIRRKLIGPQNWTSPEIVNYLRKLNAS